MEGFNCLKWMKIHFMMILLFLLILQHCVHANITNVEVRCTLSLHAQDTTSLYAETLTSYADIMLRARCFDN